MAFNAATGDRLWSFQASSAIHGAPSVIDGLVYFAACPRWPQRPRSSRSGDRGTYALNALTGKLVGTGPTASSVPPSPIASTSTSSALARVQLCTEESSRSA